jgi:hypothetical protein
MSQNLIEAARAVLKFADEVVECQDSPHRGDWGVECPLCMGELVQAYERADIEALRQALAAEEASRASRDMSPHASAVTSGQPFTPDNVLAISFTADFEPEGFAKDLITWTFIARQDPSKRLGAGLYELRFLRALSQDEHNGAYGRVLAKAEAAQSSPAQGAGDKSREEPSAILKAKGAGE